MELEFETRTTDYLRQSIEGVCRQEQTLEVIVPDASPDAARVVYCGAQAVVRSRECRAARLNLPAAYRPGGLSDGGRRQPPRALTAVAPLHAAPRASGSEGRHADFDGLPRPRGGRAARQLAKDPLPCGGRRADHGFCRRPDRAAAAEADAAGASAALPKLSPAAPGGDGGKALPRER